MSLCSKAILKYFISSERISKLRDGLSRLKAIKSDGQEISTIEWQELKNEFRLFSDYKKLI